MVDGVGRWSLLRVLMEGSWDYCDVVGIELIGTFDSLLELYKGWLASGEAALDCGILTPDYTMLDLFEMQTQVLMSLLVQHELSIDIGQDMIAELIKYKYIGKRGLRLKGHRGDFIRGWLSEYQGVIPGWLV